MCSRFRTRSDDTTHLFTNSDQSSPALSEYNLNDETSASYLPLTPEQWRSTGSRIEKRRHRNALLGRLSKDSDDDDAQSYDKVGGSKSDLDGWVAAFQDRVIRILPSPSVTTSHLHHFKVLLEVGGEVFWRLGPAAVASAWRRIRGGKVRGDSP